MEREQGVLKAREIIEKALIDRVTYEAMAARENVVWGKILPALENSDARAADGKASAALKIGRNHSSLTGVARKHDLKFKRGLTLGCGAGRLERQLLSDGICESFHGIDISEEAIRSAVEIQERDGLPLTYEVADLNFVELPRQNFDLVVAQTCLHHALRLEHLAEQVWQSLVPNGYLWVHDFIGETQGQYDEKRLNLINAVLAILPEKYRKNTINKKTLSVVERPEPGKLGSPFECIRSEDIVPVFSKWFVAEWKCEFTTLMHSLRHPAREPLTQKAMTGGRFSS